MPRVLDRRPVARRAARAAAVLGVVGLLLAGCVAPKEQTTSDDPVRTPRPDVTGGSLETFYSQQVA